MIFTPRLLPYYMYIYTHVLYTILSIYIIILYTVLRRPREMAVFNNIINAVAAAILNAAIHGPTRAQIILFIYFLTFCLMMQIFD